MDRWEGITEGGSYLGTGAPGMSGHGTTTDVQGIRGMAANRWGGGGVTTERGIITKGVWSMRSGREVTTGCAGVQARFTVGGKQAAALSKGTAGGLLLAGPFNCPGTFATRSSRAAAAVEEQHRCRARSQAAMLSWGASRCLLSRRS